MNSMLVGGDMSGEGEEFELQIPGTTIRGLRWGDSSGKNTLGFHGWLDNAGTHAHLAPYLEGLNLVSVDFPGHGYSSRLREGSPYHFHDLVPCIFDIADAFGWETFNVLAHSMGAAATFIAGGVFPDRFEKIVAIDNLGPWSTAPEDAPAQMAEGIEERNTLLEKTSRVFESQAEATATIANIYGLTSEEVAPLMERGLESVDGGCSLTYDLMLRGSSFLRFTESQVRAFLAKIEAPVQIIRPRDGWPVDSEMIQSRLECIDDVELHRVEGNHHIHLQKPADVAELVNNFF